MNLESMIKMLETLTSDDLLILKNEIELMLSNIDFTQDYENSINDADDTDEYDDEYDDEY